MRSGTGGRPYPLPPEVASFVGEVRHTRRLMGAFGCTLTELLTLIPEDWIRKQSRLWQLEWEVAQESPRGADD